MFVRVFAFLALVAVAFASPKPEPQVAYSAPAVLPVSYSGYSGLSPVAYASPYGAVPAPVPYAYTGYGGYYVR